VGFQGQQEILVRLMTEPGLREQFLADPRHTAESNGWPVSVIDDLATIPPDQLRRHGETLIRKRCAEAMKCLPLCGRVIGPACFGALFRIHASAWWPRGPKRHRDDAIAFAGVIRSHCLLGAIGPPWAGDLAAYEAEALRIRDPNRRWGWLIADHEWGELAKAVLAAEIPTVIPTRRVLIAWFRARRSGRSRSIRCRLPVFRSRGGRTGMRGEIT
jgi:hypothetical protein